MRPATVVEIGPRDGISDDDGFQHIFQLAVVEGDGDIEDLTTFEDLTIEAGSTLRVCTAAWAAAKTIHTRIADTWSKLVDLIPPET